MTATRTPAKMVNGIQNRSLLILAVSAFSFPVSAINSRVSGLLCIAEPVHAS